MLQKLIKSVFGPKKKGRAKTAKTYDKAAHGIGRERLSRGALQTVDGLTKAGYQAYVVGGAVRDLLLGLPPKDFDVATNATPEQVHAVFRRSRIIGRRFRIVHVLFGPETVEVSTFRTADLTEAETDEHGRVLRDNTFGDIVTDAERRDFTINALYYDAASETVVDYHGGVGDLRKKVLRIIGDAQTRFREDPVRMLRVARFAAKLGFSIDPKTRAPIPEVAELLSNVPSSRLFDEMMKLLLSGHAVAAVKQLRGEGLHHGLLPMLDVILEQPMGEKFVMLALARTDERILQGKGVAPGFLFAALLWHEVLKTWNDMKAKGEHSMPALYEAMNVVLDTQTEKLAIQRRFVADMREIWSVQPRFDRMNGRTPFKLLEHPRFRAAYDFMLLRAESGEIDRSVGVWWTEFYDANADQRNQMTTAPAPGSGSANGEQKKRRRRRRPAGAKEAGDTSGGNSESGATPPDA
jgi:poly(A) polymerase